MGPVYFLSNFFIDLFRKKMLNWNFVQFQFYFAQIF